MPDYLPTYSAIKAQACQATQVEFGYRSGSRDDLVAQLTCDVASRIEQPAEAVYAHQMGWNERQYRKAKKRAEKDFKARVRSGVCEAIKADREAYGFGPITIWLLWTIIGGIVSAIVQRLFDSWWNGTLFASAVLARSTGQPGPNRTRPLDEQGRERLTRDAGSE